MNMEPRNETPGLRLSMRSPRTCNSRRFVCPGADQGGGLIFNNVRKSGLDVSKQTNAKRCLFCALQNEL